MNGPSVRRAVLGRWQAPGRIRLLRARLHFYSQTRCANSQPDDRSDLLITGWGGKTYTCYNRIMIEWVNDRAADASRLPPSLWIFFDRRLKYILRLRVWCVRASRAHPEHIRGAEAQLKGASGLHTGPRSPTDGASSQALGHPGLGGAHFRGSAHPPRRLFSHAHRLIDIITPCSCLYIYIYKMRL